MQQLRAVLVLKRQADESTPAQAGAGSFAAIRLPQATSYFLSGSHQAVGGTGKLGPSEQAHLQERTVYV